MPRMIIITSILVSIVLFSALSIWYTYDVRDSLTVISAEAIIDCQEKNQIGLQTNAKKLSNSWESRQHILSLYIRHDELGKIDSLLVELNSYAKSETYYEANAQLNQLIYSLDHLAKKELPSFDNIF